MKHQVRTYDHERDTQMSLRAFADQAFSRAAGAALIDGNGVRLLRDARENYPAWLDAIDRARARVHFENYIIREDETGEAFADALVRKAREGVTVRLVYDWLGCFGKTSRRFWSRLQASGVEVRCYNPPRLDSPLGWLSRDHRKMLTVDGEVGFITGLCVGRMWEGVPEKNIQPWRDTGIEIRGPAVAAIEAAFAQVWAMTGEPIPEHERVDGGALRETQDMRLRIVATVPATAGMLRVDQLVAALARKRLWLTDAYYAGMPSFVQGLRSAAKDGVDVRLLVPNATDIPILKPLSRAGYYPLLEAGVRIFEWNGTMLHAKTAVADGHWARVGSTNLNVASWLGNCELDAVIEDEPFAREMEAMYLEDLTNATEVLLNDRRRVCAPGEPHHPRLLMTSGGGSAGRAAAGAVRIGNVVGAAFMNRRVLEPIETHIMVPAALLLLALSIAFAAFPALLVYPVLVVLFWLATALLYRGWKLHRNRVDARTSGLRRE
jgi:cardiolipin synthase A/B